MKTKLEYRTQLSILIEYDNFNQFISEMYNVDYTILGNEDVANDTVNHFGTYEIQELTDYEKEELDDFINNENFEDKIYVILQDLVNKKHLPENTVININVCY